MIEMNPKILIVDDEPYARQAIEMLLMKESYELFFAEDAHEALAQLDDEIPDVILSDVMMPNMDGFELCQRIKRNPKWNHVPIILVTALDSKQDLARGLEAGADDFLHKPINGLELRARVRSMLRIKLRHDELQAALQMRQDLANMIVHDIRSPLSTILIYCDLMEAELDGNVQTLDTIRGEANRLSSFLTDMLMMAKMEHGRLMLSQSQVDVNELATAVCDSYAPMARLKEVDLALDLPDETKKILLDANLWRRVLDNLVSNAVKFSPTKGNITLRVRYDGPGVASSNGSSPHLNLQVIDEGPGIAPEHYETIFDKFQIVATGRRDVKQVGLGLAFCKMVVEAHNGRISVQANKPRGSVFTVEL
ncbi:MAG: hybrid sensor histidine kinase/response regulator [Ardenticatenaceae bacterium]|nr:MAG: hybrid sensor histidine kinase/response regulator [Ardenticatenaceae bacterium]